MLFHRSQLKAPVIPAVNELQRKRQLISPTRHQRIQRSPFLQIQLPHSINNTTLTSIEENEINIALKEPIQTTETMRKYERKQSVTFENVSDGTATTSSDEASAQDDVAPKASVATQCAWYCWHGKTIFVKCLLFCLYIVLGIMLAPVTLIVLMICWVSYFIPELK